MLPDEVVKKSPEPNVVGFSSRALDSLLPGLAKTTHVATLLHLMLARERFEDVFGDTRGMSGAKVRESYAEYLLVPFKTLLLNVRGSDQLENVGPEKIRQALNQYLELVLLLLPVQDAVNDEEQKAVSRCMSEWRKKKAEK